MEGIQQLLDDFGAKHGIPDLMFDETASCTLAVDSGTTLHLQYDDARNALFLLASLGTIPEGTEASVYGALLYANLFWAETQGATLALEPESGELVLQFSEDTKNLTTLRLEQVIINFVDAVGMWHERVAELVQAALEAVSAEAPGRVDVDTLRSKNILAG